jgi:hypothetical protein
MGTEKERRKTSSNHSRIYGKTVTFPRGGKYP